MITCPNCGNQNRPGAQFCNGCGTQLTRAQSAPPPAETPDTKPPPQDAPAIAAPPSGDQPASVEEARPSAAPDLELPPVSQPASGLETKPLSAPAFAPLPPGALLNGRRYQVVEVISKSPKLNAYLVEDRLRRHCPKCGSMTSKVDDEYCTDCGASFSDEPLEHPGYLLRETLDPDMLAQETRIAELGLRHDGLVNIYHAFQERPYEPHSRFYVVSDPDEGTSLTSLPHPQPEEKVLAWSKQLAEALAYLHTHGVIHRNIRPENIRLVDSQAKLTNFGLAEVKAPKAAPKEWFANDIRALSQALHGLLEGQTPSPAVAAIFNKALSPNLEERYATAEALAADLSEALEALRRPSSVTLLVGRRSDPGRVRELNEDSLLTLEIEQVLQSVSTPVGLYAVADGMGGHSAGEIASALSISTLARTILSKVMLPVIEEAQAEASATSSAEFTPRKAEGLSAGPGTILDYGELLKEACLEANRAVYERGRTVRSDMGTTLVAALVVGSEAYIANIGDSRAYRVNGQEIQQITTDHSVVERLVATGQITKEEARTHPDRNLIYRTIGDKPQVEIDVFHQSLNRGDWLVLCSDGLHGLVEDAQIQQMVTTCLHPQAACEELVRLANQAGGDDNITVIAIKVEEMGGAA